MVSRAGNSSAESICASTDNFSLISIRSASILLRYVGSFFRCSMMLALQLRLCRFGCGVEADDMIAIQREDSTGKDLEKTSFESNARYQDAKFGF